MKTFDSWLKQWNLIVDGDPIITQTSHILPVQYKEIPCMLKIALIEEERIGGQLMTWWQGQGAANVFLQDEQAILMERATGSHSLMEMARHSKDDEASAIICSVITKLHSVSRKPLPEKLVPLSRWFRSLEMIAIKQEGLLTKAWLTAQYLLCEQREIIPLHGDIHHQNILDFGVERWLAIDPKGLLGERYFDYANIFCNPDEETATKPGRLEKQAHLISELAGLDYERLLQWILSYAGLSASWHLEEGSYAGLALEVAQMSANLLGI